jgi:hypothetical protein
MGDYASNFILCHFNNYIFLLLKWLIIGNCLT